MFIIGGTVVIQPNSARKAASLPQQQEENLRGIMKKLGHVFLTLMLTVTLAGTAAASDFAAAVVDHSDSLDASGFYNDPEDLTGKPAQYCAGWPAAATDHISIVEPSWGDGYITTFNEGDWAILSFDHQVMDDAANPYGIDFIVYGNAFFVGNGYVADDTDHGSYTLTGGIFSEPVLVSVSQDGENWYTYDSGPYGDTLYPTNPWVWDQDLYDTTGNGWTAQENDYTKPVDPSLTLAELTTGTSADAMALYDGSAGGTGFDLAESGYDWIQYVKFEGVAGICGGEVDAIADVAPVPVPGAVWLLGSGLIGLLGMRRKKLH